MALRATRQYIDVLSQGEGELRATRQYIDVLSQGEGTLRATRQYADVLFSFVETFIESLADTLTVNDEALAGGIFHKSANDSSAFVDWASIHKSVNVTTSFVITDNAHLNYDGNANDVLTINDDVFYNLLENDFLYCPDILTITETVDVETGNWRYAGDSLVISQQVSWAGPKYPDPIATRINFSEILVAAYPKRESVEEEVEFLEIAGRGIPQTPNDILTITDTVARRCIATDSLTFVEYVTVAKSGEIITYLELEETLTLQGNYTRAIVENTGLGHTLTYYLLSPCIDKMYGPFIGESTVGPDPPSIDLPVVQGLPSGVRFRLEYPARGGVEDTVDLVAPYFGNLDRLAMDRVNRETRGGDLVIFADPDWPKRQTVSVTFSGLTRTEIINLQRFIADHLGEEIHVTDWEGREWEAVIITPNEPATYDGRDNCSIGFEFEGILYGGLQSGEGISFQQTVICMADRRPQVIEILEIYDSVVFLHILA